MTVALLPRYERVIILCPENITGGPEALHQLGHTINRLGGTAIMAYLMGENTLQFSGNRLLCTPRPNAAFRAAYAAYGPVTETVIPLTQNTLTVFPEVFPIDALQFRQGPRAIWWLSVDNAIQQTPALGYASLTRELFGEDSLIHFHQSCYAGSYLVEKRARKIVPLFDYVAREYRLRPEAAAAKSALSIPRKVAIFPRKGRELAQLFIKSAPDLSYSLIENMSRAQVGSALAESSVYIDFGHQPGKDRVPREASLAGNVVFLHEKGAAACYGDYPVDRTYLFTQRDLASGLLATRVREALADYPQHLAKQAPLRQQIILEPEVFAQQVASAFFVAAE